MSCARIACPFAGGCPRGYKAVPKPGHCCPQCVEGTNYSPHRSSAHLLFLSEQGECSIRRGRAYRSLDGAEFNMGGSCAYILAEDCLSSGRPAFRVIVQNGKRRPRRKDPDGTQLTAPSGCQLTQGAHL